MFIVLHKPGLSNAYAISSSPSIIEGTGTCPTTRESLYRRFAESCIWRSVAGAGVNPSLNVFKTIVILLSSFQKSLSMRPRAPYLRVLECFFRSSRSPRGFSHRPNVVSTCFLHTAFKSSHAYDRRKRRRCRSAKRPKRSRARHMPPGFVGCPSLGTERGDVYETASRDDDYYDVFYLCFVG